MESWEHWAPQVSAIASILAVLTSLFIPYRMLIQSKDAEIQVLQQRIVDYKEKLQELKDAAPDVAVGISMRRADEYKKSFVDAETHRLALIEELAVLKAGDFAEENNKISELEEQVNKATILAGEIGRERDSLQNKLKKTHSSLSSYVKNGIVGVSLGRQMFIAEVVRHLGTEKVVEASPEILSALFQGFVEESERGLHMQFNFKALRFPLETAGLLDRQGKLTHEGVQVFQKIALDITLTGNRYS